MIKLEEVTKYYSSKNKIIRALNNVSLSIETNGIVAISGESGSGKSTLLKIISKDLICDSGNCETVSDIVSVYQDFKLIEAYTVYENIYLMASMYYDKDESKSITEQMINELHLENVINVKAFKLSTGERQRVAIARALVSKSSILILDEPTANLDKDNAKNIIDILIKQRSERLLIISTHDERIKDVADRIITLENGSIINDENKSNQNLIITSNNPKHINFKYILLHNLYRYPLGTVFSIIMLLLTGLSVVFGILLIDNSASVEIINDINGILDNKTLIYNNSGLKYDEYSKLKYDYDINPFYLTKKVEFELVNKGITIEAGYESIRLSNMNYGRIAQNENEACLYITSSIQEPYSSATKYLNGQINIGNYQITIVGVKFVDSMPKGICFAYNDRIKAFLNYSSVSFVMKNGLYPSVEYGDLNKLVIPEYVTEFGISSYFSKKELKYKINYSGVEVEKGDVDYPVLYLSLYDVMIPDDVYEILIYDENPNLKNIECDSLDISEYTTKTISKTSALNRSIKILVIIIGVIAIVFVGLTMYLVILSTKKDSFNKINLLYSDIRAIIKLKFLSHILNLGIIFIPLAIISLIILGFGEGILAVIIFALSFLLLVKVGEKNAKIK